MLVRFLPRVPNASPKGPATPAPGQRARRVGVWILIAGLGAAGLLYWLETRRTGPGIEELMPGYARANSRQIGVFYGHAGEVMWGWRQTLADPATQAGLIVFLTAAAAGICFRIAWLEAEHAKDG